MNVCSASFRMLSGSLSCIEREMSSTRAPVDSQALSATPHKLKSATRHPQVPMTLRLMPALPCVCIRWTWMSPLYPFRYSSRSALIHFDLEYRNCYPSGENLLSQHLLLHQTEFLGEPSEVSQPMLGGGTDRLSPVKCNGTVPPRLEHGRSFGPPTACVGPSCTSPVPTRGRLKFLSPSCQVEAATRVSDRDKRRGDRLGE
jgi:hypothetical protein